MIEGLERFGGCFARLDRAVDHRDAFGEAWAEFLADHPYQPFVEVADDGRGFVGIRRHVSFPPRMALLVGEFLYELRAALDNCLYEVAVLHSGHNPPPGHGVLQFPIYDDRANWDRNLYRLKYLSDEHRELLERIQPYHVEEQYKRLNCLAMLNDLARIDRHRTLHLVGAAVVEGGLLLEAPPGSVLTTLSKVDRPVIDEVAEIATFQVTPWKIGQAVGMQPNLVLEVEIAEMAADRPWGSLSRRFYALHKSVGEYIHGLAAYALGYTEPDPAVGAV